MQLLVMKFLMQRSYNMFLKGIQWHISAVTQVNMYNTESNLHNLFEHCNMLKYWSQLQTYHMGSLPTDYIAFHYITYI